MSRAAAEAIGMRLNYPFRMTDCARGASASLTAFPTSRHVCVTAHRHLQYPNSLAAPGVQSTCCCCYVYSRNKQRLEHLERHGTPLRDPVEKCNHDCKWHLCLQIGPLCGLGGWSLQVCLSFSSLYAPGHRFWVSIGHLPL